MKRAEFGPVINGQRSGRSVRAGLREVRGGLEVNSKQPSVFRQRPLELLRSMSWIFPTRQSLLLITELLITVYFPGACLMAGLNDLFRFYLPVCKR
jgi:hypothetical protein